MLNLRQLNKTDNSEANSDVQHFSRFSIDFRVPSDLLGNIGEPFDHSQSERLHEDDHQDRAAPTGRQSEDGVDMESVSPIAGPSGVCKDYEELGVDLESTAPVAGSSGTQDDQVVNAPRMSNEDSRTVNLTEQVRFHLYRAV